MGVIFSDSIPKAPGVYQFFNAGGEIIYIGKAKNLRRRLSQYKNTKRRKKHQKMRKIVADAARVEYQVLQTEWDAELLEARLIQVHRPKWNVVGAFYFLYPMLGLKWEEGALQVCYTTSPNAFAEDCFSFYGCFRSRQITSESFFSLVHLLTYVGHRVRMRKKNRSSYPRFTYVYEFRQLSEELIEKLGAFWMGDSKEFLEVLVLDLVENAGARMRAAEVQEHLNHLTRFWRHEVIPLVKACEKTSSTAYPIPQTERDLLFLKARRQPLQTESS